LPIGGVFHVEVDPAQHSRQSRLAALAWTEDHNGRELLETILYDTLLFSRDHSLQITK